MTNIEIAHRANLKPITKLVGEKLGIEDGQLEPYGHFKAKLSLDYLGTLPEKEFRASFAEIIKAAVISDRRFFDWLRQNLSGLVGGRPPIVREAIVRAIAIKASVIGRDPNEAGVRAILNYGHTVAHALERATGYGRLRHGEAVAWGMEVAARISLRAGACSPEAVELQHGLLSDVGLLAEPPTVPHAKLIEAMRHDKKSRAGELHWVLLREIGRAEYGRSVDSSVVDAALAEVLSDMGRTEEALEAAAQALRLKSEVAGDHLASVGSAYAVAGCYAEARVPLQRYLSRYPNMLHMHLMLAVVYSELGQAAEARAEAAEVLRLNPHFSLEVHKQRVPIKDPATLERQLAALRKAGLK